MFLFTCREIGKQCVNALHSNIRARSNCTVCHRCRVSAKSAATFIVVVDSQGSARQFSGSSELPSDNDDIDRDSLYPKDE